MSTSRLGVGFDGGDVRLGCDKRCDTNSQSIGYVLLWRGVGATLTSRLFTFGVRRYIPGNRLRLLDERLARTERFSALCVGEFLPAQVFRPRDRPRRTGAKQTNRLVLVRSGRDAIERMGSPRAHGVSRACVAAADRATALTRRLPNSRTAAAACPVPCTRRGSRRRSHGRPARLPLRSSLGS